MLKLRILIIPFTTRSYSGPGASSGVQGPDQHGEVGLCAAQGGVYAGVWRRGQVQGRLGPAQNVPQPLLSRPQGDFNVEIVEMLFDVEMFLETDATPVRF